MSVYPNLPTDIYVPELDVDVPELLLSLWVARYDGNREAAVAAMVEVWEALS